MQTTATGRYLCQALDVVICDSRPAILARNIILFRLLYIGVDLSKLWCIFYSKLIDDACLTLLQECAFDLLSLGCDINDWNQSDFGEKVLK